MAKQVLTTTQGENLAAIPWQVYPRPQMKREAWENLNGTWEFGVGETHRSIVVPFAPESRLSGIGEHFPEGSCLCYRREFAADPPEPADFSCILAR